MSPEAWIVNMAATFVLISGVARNWWVAQGTLKPVYWLMLLMAVANTLINVTISVNDPQYWGLWSYNLLNIWSFGMAIKGLQRLRVEEQEDGGE
jgi:hypothetical protein